MNHPYSEDYSFTIGTLTNHQVDVLFVYELLLIYYSIVKMLLCKKVHNISYMHIVHVKLILTILNTVVTHTSVSEHMQ